VGEEADGGALGRMARGRASFAGCDSEAYRTGFNSLSICGGIRFAIPPYALAMDRWQVEGKRRIFGHGGCGAGLIREATRRNTDSLRESRPLRHRRRKNSHA